MTIEGPADLPAPPKERMTFAEYLEWLAFDLPPLSLEDAVLSAELSRSTCEEIVRQAHER